MSHEANASAAGPMPVVAVADLHKNYGEHHVLKGISLRAHEGDVVSLIGASGSGKSTLLRCINLLEIPDAGRISINGEEVRLGRERNGTPKILQPRQVERLRTQLSMVFQSFNLWPHRTVLENVIEAPVYVHGEKRQEAIAHAEHLLEKVGMADKRHSYPAFLSGGQQQRVAIARALAMRPNVMLFDEPTSALDPEMVGEVLRVIRGIAEEGCSMILVTHEMAFARDVSSHVVYLHQGLVEEEGPPQQVMLDPHSERCRQFVMAQDNRC
ncbi:ABC transporter ATP-binding protein [Pseudomonas sp. TTU2014-080ASC]|uniref:ABC transporter ATP-binding protein n=1 Tax=Pseudomonas sp. TTU2014-080ASC TaxID=1729724 RepID=UPI0007187961|nr:ATP-binding cassette domain-containing protein [Pseudomonas sp. TTU2014-080ASC]KRW58769.1 amino acid transporter [Pseudomonas sp. TTU2014-080ASC]